jgi:AraC-like DNA-binding protein
VSVGTANLVRADAYAARFSIARATEVAPDPAPVAPRVPLSVAAEEQRALSLLIEAERFDAVAACNVTEAALKVGFLDRARFIRQFRAKFGMTPTEFVKASRS